MDMRRAWDVVANGEVIGAVHADGKYEAVAELHRAIAEGRFPVGSLLVVQRRSAQEAE